jgi:hypothetical protein
MNFIRNYFQKRTNNFLVNQDYEFAKQLNQAIDELVSSGKSKYGQLIHIEGIFLDLTDRTQAHPRVPFATEDRGGKFVNLVKEFGFGNRKIIWKSSDLFNVDNYFEDNWFPASLEMHALEYQEMLEAKLLYQERRINFMEYFFKRLELYNYTETANFVKYYEYIDLEKYKKKLRDIMFDLPVMTKEGVFE